MKKNIIANIILLILLVGCSAQPQIVETATNITLQATSTKAVVIPTNTVLPTAERALPTPTETHAVIAEGVTATSQPALDNVIHQCLRISTTLPDSSDLPDGSLVLLNQSRKSQGSVVYNPKTGEETQLPNEERGYINGDITISPDNQWIAYTIYNGPSMATMISSSLLVIATPDGKVEKEISFTSLKGLDETIKAKYGRNYGLLQWLDNDHLLIGYGVGWATSDSPAGSTKYDSHTLILDPFNGQQKIVDADFPGHDHSMNSPGVWGNFIFTRAVFDPFLHYAVYPSYNDVVLYDLNTSREVTRFPELPYTSFSQPIWAKDGKSFLIELPEGNPLTDARYLYQITSDGKKHRLTPFIENGQMTYVNFSWSPDEKTVAFWLRMGEDKYQLGVLNTATGQVSDLCVPGYMVDRSFPSNSPIWSPDSRFLAVSSNLTQEQDHNQVLLVDLQKKEGYKVADDSFPVGWVTKP